MLDDILAQIDADVRADPRQEYSYQEHLDDVAQLRDYLQTRADKVRMQLP
jgi:hypothetical protein